MKHLPLFFRVSGTTFLTPSYIAVILEAGVILVLIVAVAFIVRNRRKPMTSARRSTYPKMTSATDETSDERQPIVRADTYVDNKSYETYDHIG